MRTTIVDGAPIVVGGGPSLSAHAREELQLRGQIIDLWIENRRLEHELHWRQQINPDRSRRLAASLGASLGDRVSLAEFWAENCPRPAWIDPRHNVTVVDGVTIIGGTGAPVSADVREQGRLRKQIAELWFDNKQLEQRLQLLGDFNANHEPPGSPEGGRFAGASVHLATHRGRNGPRRFRIGGRLIEGTNAQFKRLIRALRSANEAIDELRKLVREKLGGAPRPSILKDPSEPEPGKADIEELISDNEDKLRQAKDTFKRLTELAYDPDKKRNNFPEVETALRYERDLKLTFKRSTGGGEDYVDNFGRTWDFMGSGVDDFILNLPGNAAKFFARLQKKLRNGAADKIGLDLTYLGAQNKDKVLRFIETLPAFERLRIQIMR